MGLPGPPPATPARAMKRLFGKLVLFLVAGAIINVAVAWGANLFTSTPNGVHSKVGQWPCDVPSSWPPPQERWLLTGWGRVDDVYFSPNAFVVNIEQAGWPWASLETVGRHTPSGGRWSHSVRRDGTLPMYPLWAGFAANSFVYATV